MEFIIKSIVAAVLLVSYFPSFGQNGTGACPDVPFINEITNWNQLNKTFKDPITNIIYFDETFNAYNGAVKKSLHDKWFSTSFIFNELYCQYSTFTLKAQLFTSRPTTSGPEWYGHGTSHPYCSLPEQRISCRFFI